MSSEEVAMFSSLRIETDHHCQQNQQHHPDSKGNDEEEEDEIEKEAKARKK